MIEFKVNQNHLKAVALAAAKGDVRDYLNGVRIEVYTDHVVMVATNGHQLIAINIFCDTGLNGAPKYLTLHNDYLSAILSVKTTKDNRNVIFTHGEDYTGWNAEVAGVVVKCEVRNDNYFVDWRAKVPQSVSGEVSQFNLNLLNTINKSAALFKEMAAKNIRTLKVFHNGTEGASVVRDLEDDNFLALVMPLRDNRRVSLTPGWLTIQS